MASVLDFKQSAAVLKSIVDQATGRSNIAATDTASFTQLANIALTLDYDQLATGISRVLARTIFSNRPYTSKFNGLMKSEIDWGNHVRKINYCDSDPVDNEAWKLTDGSSVDQYTVKKPKVLQTNFYGGDTFSDYVTRYDYQLKDALTGPDQWGAFFAGVMQNIDDQMEQRLESFERGAVANFIGGHIESAGLTSNPFGTESVVHLVTVYNDQTGKQLTSETVKAPENYTDFTRWAFGYIQTLAQWMSERTALYHTSPTGYKISRHTPRNRLKAYLYAPENNQIDSRVMNSFNEGFLKYVDHESVGFWQSIQSPDGINVKASYLGLDGQIKTATAAKATSDIYGVLFDEEAIGVTLFNKRLYATPMNARGGYINYWWHVTARYWNDFTENGIVLLLD